MCIIVKGSKRQRYIGFVVKTSYKNLDKSDMIREIQRKCKYKFKKDCKEMGIRLIRFDGTNGILKCYNIGKENAITLLQSIKQINSKEVNVVTLATSGTIRSLINKHMENLIKI